MAGVNAIYCGNLQLRPGKMLQQPTIMEIMEDQNEMPTEGTKTT